MTMLASFFVRLRGMVNRPAADADLDDELRYHLERETERNIANGMSPGDARDAARRAFGNPTVHAESARDPMRWMLLEELRQDTAYALHAFRRAPTFVATVVLTIGLGLGLVTAAFTLFDAYVLRPIAARDPSTLYTLVARSTTRRDYFFSWRETQAIAARPAAPRRTSRRGAPPRSTPSRRSAPTRNYIFRTTSFPATVRKSSPGLMYSSFSAPYCRS